jgi:hypothetical protein
MTYDNTLLGCCLVAYEAAFEEAIATCAGQHTGEQLMLTKNFRRLQTEVQRHVAADQVAQGSYKTCFIGCLAKQKDSPEFIESE